MGHRPGLIVESNMLLNHSKLIKIGKKLRTCGFLKSDNSMFIIFILEKNKNQKQRRFLPSFIFSIKKLESQRVRIEN
jgi:hypothetical protein